MCIREIAAVDFIIRTAKGERRLERIIIIKLGIMVGIVASYYLPTEVAAVAGLGTNLVWLWKT